jgi:cytidylate kinase
LMHEFMHIHRRDLIGQLISQCMCAAYWFHPAAWFMKRRLTEAREWATDRQLVDDKIDARQYAETLLNIVSRMDERRAPASGIQSGAIAMSSPGAIEDHLRRLLQSSPPRSFPLRLSGKIAIGLLMLLVAVTTVRVEQVAAQTGTSTAAATETVIAASQNENDLFSRIRDCDVLTVTGDQFDAIFSVDGVVLSDSGEPVAGAIVLLRESSTCPETKNAVWIRISRWCSSRRPRSPGSLCLLRIRKSIGQPSR